MSTHDPSEQIDRLAEEFVTSWREGKSPSITEYAQRHPDIADDIRDLFPLLTTMEDIKQDMEPALDLADTKLGDYRLVREIGRGGMGVVYEAVQETLGRRVALKVLPSHATRDPRYLERFRTEAQAAGRLHHPNIVPVIGYGEHDGIHYYTMQYVEGRGIDEMLREVRASGEEHDSPRRRFQRAARVVLDAADAMAAAHAQGVLHRDVKPSNLMLDDEGSVWVTDFGLCKEVGSDDLTHSGDILGTLRYMPPERLQGESDVQGDVYGLGVTLYEMLTLQPAYGDEDRVQLFARIAREDPRRPRAIDARIPADLESIVLKAIARDRGRRYATADALASDLRAYLEGRPIAARAPTFGYHLRTAIRRHYPLAITAGLAGLVLIASSVFYVLSLRTKEADARFQTYVAHIGAAEAALESGTADAARRLLDAAPAEFRNWEWHHLQARLDRSLRRSHPGVPTHGITWSPDGAWLAVGADQETWIYRDADGSEHAHLAHGGRVRVVRWSPDGDHLAVGTGAGLEVWAWPSRKRLYVMEDVGALQHLEFTPDGRRVVVGGDDGVLRVFETEAGTRVAEIPVHSIIQVLAVHPDGARVATGTWDGHVTLWEIASGKRLWWRQASRRGLHGVCFVGRDLVATPCEEPHTQLWSVQDGTLVRTLSNKYQAGAATAFASPDGRYLVVGAGNGAHVWSTATWDHLVRWDVTAPVDDLAFHPLGTRFAVASPAGMVTEWRLGPGDPNVLRGHIDDVGAVAYAPSGAFFVTAGIGGDVRVWDARTREQTRTWIGHRWNVGCLAVDAASCLVAAGDAMGEIVLWDVATDEPAHRLEGHPEPVPRVAFVPGGVRLASTGEDGCLCLWDGARGARLARIEVGDGPLGGLAVHPRDGSILTGDEEGVIRVHDGSTLRVVRELLGHRGAVTGLAFDHDGGRLASVSRDQTLRIWDVAAGTVTHTSRAQTASSPDFELLDVAFTLDGSRIATSSKDGTVRLWDTASGSAVATLGGHDAWVPSVAFSPDSTELLSGSGAAEIRVWDTHPLGRRFLRGDVDVAREARALALVAALAGNDEDPDAAIAALKTRVELQPDEREAALRVAHRLRGTAEALIARLWRDVTPPQLDSLRRWIARGLASGMNRAAGHRNRQDSRRATLWGALTCRLGDHELAVERLRQARMLNEEREPALFAVDLAFLTMAHVGLGQLPDAALVLAQLERLLVERPSLRSPRLDSFVAEARDALAEARKAETGK